MTDDTQEGALPADETQGLVAPEVLEEEAEVQQPSGGEAGITEARLIEILAERDEKQARKDQSAKDRGETKAARAFWKDTPQLELYMDLRDETLPKIDDKVEHFGAIIPEAKPPLYRHEEEGPSDIVPQSFNVDKRQAFIDDLVRNYSNAYTNTSGQRKNITEGIRKLADRIFPGTRAQSNHYYKLLDAQKLEAATKYVSTRPELEARIAWEYDRIQTSEQIVAGRLYKAAGREGFDEEPAELPPQQVQAVEGPLGRLLEDLDGLPEHLQDAYGTGDQ